MSLPNAKNFIKTSGQRILLLFPVSQLWFDHQVLNNKNFQRYTQKKNYTRKYFSQWLWTSPENFSEHPLPSTIIADLHNLCSSKKVQGFTVKLVGSEKHFSRSQILLHVTTLYTCGGSSARATPKDSFLCDFSKKKRFVECCVKKCSITVNKLTGQITIKKIK